MGRLLKTINLYACNTQPRMQAKILHTYSLPTILYLIIIRYLPFVVSPVRTIGISKFIYYNI